MKTLLNATVTLNAIRANRLCGDGWTKLLRHLGKTKADDEPLPLLTILESNGIDDALWCLRALPEEYEPACQMLACDFAEAVLPIFERDRPDDDRPRNAIETARRYARGEATREELAAAGATAGAAARAAAWDAAGAAASDAASDAAGAAAGAAARAAAWATASAAAWDAARDAWAAASDAASDAAWATAGAAARDAAWDAAWAAARDEQSRIFHRHLTGEAAE
jgi:hypothetical protein